MTKTKGSLFVISAPSGAGKTSLVKALLERKPHLRFSISYTTRKQRPTEQPERDYFFVDHATFEKMVSDGEFLEYAKVFDNYYGTSKAQVKEILASGQHVILEIDWQGAQQVRKLMPETVSLFILPPSLACLRQRLTARGQDNDSVIEQRMSAAINEMSHYIEADYLIINDDFTTALAQFQALITSQHLRLARQAERHNRLLQELLA